MWRPPDDFPPTGKRCRACFNRERRERYLSVERAAAIERATLRFVMAAEDPVVTCGRCSSPLLPGEDVVAVAAELIHARHLEGSP